MDFWSELLPIMSRILLNCEYMFLNAITFTNMFSCSSVSQVSEAFLQLVFDETKDGASLMVLLKGSQYYTSNFLEWSDI